MFSKDKVSEFFCIAYDFCKFYDNAKKILKKMIVLQKNDRILSLLNGEFC